MDGILNIYKEAGYTSHDVVAKLRGILGMKKIGHTGTLDPAAEGVLPVCLGKATKLCDLLTDKDKTYRAGMLLGKETDTQDMTGTVLRESPVEVTEDMVRRTAAGFTGTIRQIPPMYSAVRVNGQHLYQLARRGQTVERPAREVKIYGIAIEEMAIPHVTLYVECSKGTYIRTLIHDMGQALGCGAAMDSLVRIRAGAFRVEESLRLAEVEALRDRGELASAVTPIAAMLTHLPSFYCAADREKELKNGNPLRPGWGRCPDGTGEEMAVFDENGSLVGVYRLRPETGMLHPVKRFL